MKVEFNYMLAKTIEVNVEAVLSVNGDQDSFEYEVEELTAKVKGVEIEVDDIYEGVFCYPLKTMLDDLAVEKAYSMPNSEGDL